jgi:hypothetical protein
MMGPDITFMRDDKAQRSGRMADPQDQPNREPDDASAPPEKNSPAKAAKKTAKAPAKKTAKAPAKKAPAKKAPAKKATAKKAPAKKAPAKRPEHPEKSHTPAGQPLAAQQRIETNGDLAAAAKDAAAQAKSTVESANNPVSPEVPAPAPTQSRAPLIVALVLSLVAILLIRQLRRR